MRLSSIKLAGFKSFVDPTTVHFPGNLCAVVGPNGCGKSNIIDAVRWVMGESSAKTLRGESMTDVIFSGSSARMPVGQASVELLFDNSDGSLKGEYSAYNEISVRRTVNRDVQSIYYLNSRRCRRRDIQDLFLGTGLGPRSYSIIEQGTISRFVDAKPEELRIYIEEAAGISKYKERRRETENRMRHTRENLERLADIREELGRQLHHLQRQSRAAERYSEFKREERGRRAELQVIRWKALNDDHQSQEKKVRATEVHLESVHAELCAVDTEIEKLRQQHLDTTEVLQAVQEEFYKVGTQIARYEQNIQNQQERAAQMGVDLTNTDATLQNEKKEMGEDEIKLRQLAADLTQLAPELKTLRQQLETLSKEQETAVAATLQCQQQWDEFNQNFSEVRQKVEVEQSHIQHLEQSIAQLKERILRSEKEHGGLDHRSEQAAVKELESKINALDKIAEQQKEHVAGLVEAVRWQRESNHKAGGMLDQLRRNMQEKQGRLASLETLQQMALGQMDTAIVQWLKKNRLHNMPRLGQELSVEKGWEKAVEMVLGDYLQAVCMSEEEDLAVTITDLICGDLTLIRPAEKDLSVERNSNSRAYLLEKITTLWDLNGLLSGVRVAETLEEALQLRSELGCAESAVTREGVWVSRGWIRVHREANKNSSVLERQEKLKQLSKDMLALEKKAERLEADLAGGLLKLKNLEQARETGHQELNSLLKQRSETRSELSARKTHIEQQAARVQRIEHEIEEDRIQLKQQNTRLDQAQLNWKASLVQVKTDAERRELLVVQRDSSKEQLEVVRSRVRQAEDHLHKLALREQSLLTRQEFLQTGMQRLQLQLVQLETRKQSLESDMAAAAEPLELLRQSLYQRLQKRLVLEQRLATVRTDTEQLEARLAELEKKRSAVELQAGNIRNDLEQQRMQWQAVRLQQESIEHQLLEMKQGLSALLKQLPEGAEEASWVRKLERLQNKIQRLGPINLAAIDEYQMQFERSTYLDSQNADLEEALATLENAIRKIDAETKTRFKETFDLINNRLQEVFPKIFGGGHAYLELTSDDLLDTGVTVMARPPGKRNSTIHLLSGGEKALTAIAMVFSIFQLNPAPFCMLDEVDAPLDDTNVGRYCRLVEAMAETIQFIFITHNKVTMEMAGQMMGITMHEPGVSRLVSVDMDEAAGLAASSISTL